MDVLKNDVENLIEVKSKHSIISHFWNAISNDMRSKGCIVKNSVLVWRQNNWNAFFYPVFTFKFNKNKHLVEIKDSLNPFGKLFIVIISVAFIYFISPKNILSFNLLGNWQWFVITATFMLLVTMLSRKIYKTEKNNQLELIYEFLGIQSGNQNTVNEWSLTKVLTRLFTYPFCVFIIAICIWGLIENSIKGLFPAIPGICVCLVYLYFDIELIRKHKKSKST
jgi:hypothetical protein